MGGVSCVPELTHLLASAAIDIPLNSQLSSCGDPLLRSQLAALILQADAPTSPLHSSLPSAAAAFPDIVQDEEVVLLGPDSEALLLQRAVALCALSVGALLNKYGGEACCSRAVEAVMTLVASRTGVGVGQWPSSTAENFPVDSPRLQERGILVAVWVSKGLLMRSHPAAARCLAALTSLLGGGAALASGVIAATGVGQILEDGPPNFPLTRGAGAVTSSLYKQRLFETTMGLLAASSAEAQPLLLLCVCTMAPLLPQPVLTGQTARLLPIVLRSLEQARGQGRLPVCDALAQAALLTLRVVEARSAPAVAASPHLGALVPLLLSAARRSRRPLARGVALECLRALAAAAEGGAGGGSFHKLFPLRAQVLRELVPVLDDENRAVRRRAQSARADWATIASV